MGYPEWSSKTLRAVLASGRIDSRPLLIDSDVINMVILGENGVLIGIPRPNISNRQVQENKVRFMELVISVGVGDLLSAILNSIHKVVDVICIPDHADDMETISKCACGQGKKTIGDLKLTSGLFL
jgi:hypothetical protein